MANKINFSVGFQADKNSQNELLSMLKQLQNFSKENVINMGDEDAVKTLNKITATASAVEAALKRAYNTKLSTVNIEKFNAELEDSQYTLQEVQTNFQKAGAAGENAFRKLSAQILSTNSDLKESHKWLDEIAETLTNTIKWNVASSVVNKFTGSIEQAYGYVKSLDTSLNNIRIVTGYSAEQMADFAVEANNAAKALGQNTTAYTEAALIYYQQGLPEDQVKTLADITLKTANVTGQSTDEVSELLTAVWNGYKVDAQEAELYVDKLAAVAAATASDLEELSVGMSKVASAASSMGIDVDQLNAMLSTIISVTRQAPESVGTALKTIFARMGDLELSGVDEEGVTLGDVSESLDSVGIKILDTTGNLRDMGAVIEEVGQKWNSGVWSDAEKQALAIDLAGSRQYNNLIALFDNWEMYNSALEISGNAMGTLQEQQDIYMESTAAHIEKLNTEMEDLYDSILNAESINTTTDAMTLLAAAANNFVDSIGGGIGVLKNLGAIGTSVFSKQLTKELMVFIRNQDIANQKAEELTKQIEAVQNAQKQGNINPDTANLLNSYEVLLKSKAKNSITDEQAKAIEAVFQNWSQALGERDLISEKLNELNIKIQEMNSKDLISDDLNIQNFNDWKNADNIGKIADNIEKELTKIQSLKEQITDDKDLISKGLFSDELLDNIDEITKKYISNGEEAKKASTLVQELAAAQYNYSKVSESRDITEEELDLAIEAEKILQKSGANLVSYLSQAETEVQRFSKSYDEITNNVTDDIEKKLKDSADSAKQAADAAALLKTQLSEQQIIENILKISGGLGSIYTISSNIKNLGSIWDDETLTAGEKLGQTLSNIGTTAIVAYTGIKNLKSGIEGLKEWSAALQSTSAASTLAGTASAKLAGGLATVGGALAAAAPQITAVSIAFSLLEPIIDKIIHKAEYAAEAFEESINTYKNTESELESLKNQLESTQNQLEELYAIAEKDLTIANKEDIATLETENKLLEAQIKAKEALLEVQKREKMQAAAEVAAAEGGQYEVATVQGISIFDTEGAAAAYDKLANSAGTYALGSTTYTRTQEEAQKAAEEFWNTWKEKQDETIVQLASDYADAILIYDDLIASNEDGRYDDAIAYYQQIIGAYEQYKAVTDETEETNTQASEQVFNYTEAIEILNQAIVSLKENGDLSELDQNAQSLLNNLIETGNFEEEWSQAGLNGILSQVEALQDLSDILKDTDWSVKLEVNTDDLISSSQLIINQADAFKEVSEMLAEDFTITADEALRLAEIYPDLLQNAIVFEDGRVQLDAASTQMILDNQKAVLEGDRDTKVAELENEIAILEAKNNFSKTLLEILKSDSVKEIGLAQTVSNNKEKISDALTDYLIAAGQDQVSAQETANNAIEKGLVGAFEAAANSSYENTKVMVENLNKFIEAANQAAKAITTGDGEQVDTSGMAGAVKTGTQENDSQSGKKIFEDWRKRFNLRETAKKEIASSEIEAAIDSVVSSLEESIELTDEQIANLKATIAALYANTNEAINPTIDQNKGGSSKKKEIDDLGQLTEKELLEEMTFDETEDLTDRYHDVNLEIQHLSTGLEKLQEAQDKLTGKDLIKNLNAQLAIITKQVAAQAEKLKLQKEELEERGKALTDREIGISFNVFGQIENYNEVIKAQKDALDEVKKAAQTEIKAANDEYNQTVTQAKADYDAVTDPEKFDEAYETLQEAIELATQKRDTRIETAQTTVDTAETDFEQLVTEMDEYTALLNDTITSTIDKILELLNIINEILIKKFTLKVETSLDMREAEKRWNEFYKKVISDTENINIANIEEAYKNLLSLYDTFGTGTGSIQALTKQLNDTLAQIDQANSNIFGFSSKYWFNQAAAFEDLDKYLEELTTQLEEAEDLIDSVHDSYLAAIDDINGELTNQIEKGYDYINSMLNHDMNIIELLYGDDAYDSMDSFYQQQINNNNKLLDSLKLQANFWKEQMDNAEEGSDEWEKFRDNYQSAIQDLNSYLESSLQTIIDAYTNSINSIFSQLEDKMTDGLGLDYISEQWELMNKNAEMYLDDINSAYELSKLQYKFQDAIDSTDSVSAQKQLNKLMNEQLDDLKSRDKLTQYDVERAEKLLDIELKRIALQEAQNNKTTMRLRRDSNGNYTYQYVADEEAVSQAEQELNQAENDLYNFDKEQYLQNQQEYIAIYQEMNDKIKEILLDTTLSEEEREKKLLLLKEQYGEMINNLTEQNAQIRVNLEESALMNLTSIYQNNQEQLQQILDNQDAAMAELIPTWNSGLQSMIDKSQDELMPAYEELFTYAQEAMDKMKEQLDAIQESSGINFDTIKEGTDTIIPDIEELIEDNDTLITQMDEELKRVQDLVEEVNNLAAAYEKAKEEAIAAAEAAYQAKQTNAEESNKGIIGDLITAGGALVGGAGGAAIGGAVIGGSLGGPVGALVGTAAGGLLGWLGSKLFGYDTGGYTGEWNNNDGRLALLHQKELVLNDKDTKNILDAVQLVRDLQGQTAAYQASLANSSIISPRNISNNSLTELRQEIAITATFPNVNSRTEIEEAFIGLSNQASQHILDRNR